MKSVEDGYKSFFLLRESSKIIRVMDVFKSGLLDMGKTESWGRVVAPVSSTIMGRGVGTGLALGTSNRRFLEIKDSVTLD